MGENSQLRLEYDVISKRVSVSVSKNLVLKKSGSLEKIGLKKVLALVSKKVSVSVSKIFGLKKSRYRSRMKFLVLSLSA